MTHHSNRGTGEAGALPPGDLDDLVDTAATARATLDGHGVVTGWSEGARRLLGHRPGEVVGRPASALLDGDADADAEGTVPHLVDLVDRSLARLPRWNGTLSLRHRDGHRLRTRLLAHRHATADGTTEWLLVSPLTGTLPRPRDDDLDRLAFAQSPCCTTALYDTRLRLCRANEDMQRAMALTEDEMRGLRVPEIVPDPQSDRTEQAMAQVLADGRPRYLETYLRTEGERCEHAWNVYLGPLRDADGAIRGVCLAAHDRTDQHWARQRLQLLNDAGLRIGTTLDVERTARELAEAAVPELSDFASVDLLDRVYRGAEPDTGPEPASVLLRRLAHASVLPGVPESVVGLGTADSYPAFSPPAECLATGRPVVQRLTDPGVARWAARTPSARSR